MPIKIRIAIGFWLCALGMIAQGAGVATAHLTWTAPTQNVDGTPLIDLKGFKVYYGKTAATLDTVVDVKNAGATSLDITGLDNSTAYFFSITAYNSAGIESVKTGPVSKVTPPAPPPPSPNAPTGLTVTTGNQTAYVPQGANGMWAVTRVGVLPENTPCDLSQRLTLFGNDGLPVDYYPVHVPDNQVQWSGTVKHAVLLLAKCS